VTARKRFNIVFISLEFEFNLLPIRSVAAEGISYYDVLPLQPLCPHEQSMSGVFSIASHWVLQYLPDVVTQEQTGCAHFSAFALTISVLLALDQRRMIQAAILDTGGKGFCTIRHTSGLGHKVITAGRKGKPLNSSGN
jgi:hypothetical protein